MKSPFKSYLVKASVSLLLLLFLIRKVNREDFFGLLKDLSLAYLAGYILVSLFDRLVMAYKWKILLDSKGIRVPLKGLVVIYFKGTFIGGLLPTSLGGDAIRAIELTRSTSAMEEAVSSIVMERFLGFVSSALMALMVVPLGLILLPHFPRIVLLLLLLFLAGGGVFLLFLFKGACPKAFSSWIGRLPWSQKISKVTASLGDYRDRPHILFRFSCWSFGEQLIPVAATFLLARAMGLDLPLTFLISIIPVTQFFARIPISLSGFGLQEGLFVLFFSLVGFSTTSAFTLGFASNLGNLLTSLPGAYFYFRGPGLNVRRPDYL